ncbi:MAG: AAA family ATPase [Bacteroidota bacterium]|nr:AAA family ATPase [Bacteroidota bacterium]MDW8225722.1 AAA family ATPase [Bacteroidota bacterium]
MDAIAATQKRLGEIETELERLRAEYGQLRQRWEQEKATLHHIRSLKEQIEQARVAAAEAERRGEYGRVAEIRYGRIPELERQLQQYTQALERSGRMLKEEVGAEDVAEVVAKWTGIPVHRMLEGEREKLLHMEERLHRRIVNQEDAVQAIANAIRRSRAGLQDPNRPIGSFIFLGTTGVGKTEMARALAEFLFDDENALIRLDMSEYMEKHSVARLIGAPPGYVGYEEGGQLTEAVRTRPYAVILFDEIEKAHPEVFNILLQVLEDGRLTDGKGRTVNFRNTLVIMTSNLGTELIQEAMTNITESSRALVMERLREPILELLRQRFRPEFLNRIDEILVFKPLLRDEVKQIVQLQVERLRQRLQQRDMELRVTDRALEWLATIGYDPQFGARPLRRAIERYIANPLALKVLAGEFAAGDTILVDRDAEGHLVLAKSGTSTD